MFNGVYAELASNRLQSAAFLYRQDKANYHSTHFFLFIGREHIT